MQAPDFWNDTDKANNINKEISSLKRELSLYNKINKSISENNEIIELLEIEYSEDIFNELVLAVNDCDEQLKELEINTLLNDEYDNYDCY